MRYIYSEAQNNYSNYLFSYQVFLIKEEGDSIDEIYGKGFLPVRSIKDLYYLSRSCRVNLSKFELSSENKRVIKQIGEIPTKNPITEFKFDFKDFLTRQYLDESAIKRIFLGRSSFDYVYDFRNFGIVVTLNTDELIHYAHSFYRAENVGIPMMAYMVNYAREKDKKYIYLGTYYGEKSVYKMQYKGLEFFNGTKWSDNLDELDYLVKKDGFDRKSHLLQDESYLEKFYGVSKLGRLIKKLQR